MKLSNITVIGRIILLMLVVLGILGILGAQDKPPATLKPTEIQSLRLQVKQKDALLAKNLLEQAQANFQKALADLTSEGERVRAENNWPKDTQFDPNTLVYTPAVKDAKK